MDIFFLPILMVRGEVVSTRPEAPREKNNSGALSNRRHGLFHIRYFENGPLEPGWVREPLTSNPITCEVARRFLGETHM